VTTLFVSDLHLDASRPKATQCFIHFLTDEASTARKLYILGDLFEACTGEDPLDALQAEVADALATLSQRGIRCFFMYGNRDFLISREFINRSRLTVLNDPTLIYVGGESVLLSHGDIYCTDDAAYQRYRRIVRNPVVRKIYDSLPFSIRNRIVNGLRENSQRTNQYKATAIMDVNANAIVNALREFNPNVLLHGHTHRPGIHTIEADGVTYQRIVLGDWYEQGSLLRWDNTGPELRSVAFDN
jgi:UDP-2,3-diacylglucosamine hydrolase